MTATASPAALCSHEARKLLQRFLENKRLAAELRQKAYLRLIGCTIVMVRHPGTFDKARNFETAVTYHHAGRELLSIHGIRERLAYNAAMILRSKSERVVGRARSQPSNASLDYVSAIRTLRYTIGVTGLGDPDMNELFAIVLAVLLGELTREQLIEMCIESGNKWIVKVPGSHPKETLLDC